MKLKPLKEYSLWLEPEKEELKKIKKVFSKIQKDTKSVNFTPHVTLLGGLYEKEKNLIGKLEKLSKEKSFNIHFEKISLGDDEFKTVFLKCKKSKKLIWLNTLSQKIYGAKKPFHPHMSLVYGNFKEKQKKIVVGEIKKYKISHFSFKVKNISLWKAFGTVDKWERIRKIKLI